MHHGAFECLLGYVQNIKHHNLDSIVEKRRYCLPLFFTGEAASMTQAGFGDGVAFHLSICARQLHAWVDHPRGKIDESDRRLEEGENARGKE